MRAFKALKTVSDVGTAVGAHWGIISAEQPFTRITKANVQGIMQGDCRCIMHGDVASKLEQQEDAH